MDLIGATYERDIEPGEVLIVSAEGIKSIKPFAPAPVSQCIFEHVYFARPDSIVFGRSVNEVRTDLGRVLAREQPVDADVIVPVPDSGVCAAMGYAEESGIPLRMGLIRNHYVGRTFIQPQSSIRHFGVKVKLNPVRSILDGRRVVLVDDSIVRGTTSRKIVGMVRAAGAKEVHVRISCPPTISPCYYGVDTPSREDLIAATHTLDEIRDFLEADSVAYLSLEGLLSTVQSEQGKYCRSCYTGQYPVEFPRDEASTFSSRSSSTKKSSRSDSHSDHDQWQCRRLLCVFRLLALDTITVRARSPPRRSPYPRRSSRRRSTSLAISITRREPRRRGRSAGPLPHRRSRTHAGRIRSRRRLRPLPRARADDRLQRPAHQGFDARGAGQPERSPARRRLQLLRTQPRPVDAAAAVGGTRQGSRRVRAPRPRSLARRVQRRRPGAPGAPPRGRPR
jgi:adenine/guanine phosphoribosyltransferase-like PRPP-binding protein